MILRFLKTELKRLFMRPSFFILSLLFLCFVIGVSVYFSVMVEETTDGKIIYDITEYNSFEELQEQIESAETLLKNEKVALEAAVNAGYDDFQISEKKRNISTLEVRLQAMNLLLNRKIPFANVEEYQNSSKNNAASMLLAFIKVFSIVLSLAFSMKLALMIPSETKEGQAKLTLTLPIGRTKYVFYKLALYLSYAFLSFTAACLSAMLVCAIGFPLKERYILFATTNTAFCLSFLPAALLEILFSMITLMSCCLLAFSLSLLFNKRLIALLSTLFLCFTGQLFDLIESFIGNGVSFTNYLLPCNLQIGKIFSSPQANTAWLAFVVILIYLVPILFLSSTKFKQQDILN